MSEGARAWTVVIVIALGEVDRFPRAAVPAVAELRVAN